MLTTPFTVFFRNQTCIEISLITQSACVGAPCPRPTRPIKITCGILPSIRTSGQVATTLAFIFALRSSLAQGGRSRFELNGQSNASESKSRYRTARTRKARLHDPGCEWLVRQLPTSARPRLKVNGLVRRGPELQLNDPHLLAIETRQRELTSVMHPGWKPPPTKEWPLDRLLQWLGRG